MRKHTKLFVLVAALLAVLALSAVAAPFEKVATYADGTFTDVGTQWYAKEVKSAYELGFVNGKTANSYDPNGTMTVAEAITLASRVHASYNSNTIAPVTGKWYLQYVEYAKTYGIFEEGYFNNYDRTVRRYEMAQLFANALPDDYFPAKNNVTAIPDVNENEEYADMLLMLYKAGVVMGSDEYGTFHPTDPIKRSEVAAIVNRAALPENRLAKTLTPAPVYENEAVYLIDNYDMMSSTLRYTRLKSSWNADNRYNESIIPDGVDTNVLVDAT
ncbi:MAG: S-layer homology domain-containing protein, partial [Ruminococcaceae bacterium]|nr:S-layer homology domain-containing protein [Oscillospiraceae bacterium]